MQRSFRDLKMVSSEDSATTPRPLRVFNPAIYADTDETLSICSSLSAQGSLACSLTSSKSRQPEKIPPNLHRRFPIDGDLEKHHVVQLNTQHKGSSRLSLLGSRLMKSSKRIISSRHTSSGTASSGASFIVARTTKHTQRTGAVPQIKEEISNPLRQPKYTAKLCIADLYEAPSLAVPTIRFNCFAGSNHTLWLITDVLCSPHASSSPVTASQEDTGTRLLASSTRRNDPGQLHNLLLDLHIPKGYAHLATLGHHRRDALCTGTAWTIILQLSKQNAKSKSRLPIPFRSKTLARSATMQGRPTSSVLMDELQTMLKTTSKAPACTALSDFAKAKLSYHHSHFPDAVQMSIETASEDVRLLEKRSHAIDRRRKRYGAGSLLKTQTQRFTEKTNYDPRSADEHADLELKKEVQIANSIVRLLQETFKTDTKLSELESSMSKIPVREVWSLLTDFDRAISKDLMPVMVMELRMYRNLYATILEGEKAQASRLAVFRSSHLGHRASMRRLSPGKSCNFNGSPQPPVVKLNGPTVENRRNALELDRESYDFGTVLRDLTNQDPQRGMKYASQQSRVSKQFCTSAGLRPHPDDGDVPAPLFSPRKSSNNPPSSHGYGVLEKDSPWECDSECSSMSMRATRELGGQYDVEGWTREQLRQQSDCQLERDPARAIWEKMRVSSDGSGFSDEDEERLQEMNLTSAPWM